MVWQCMICSRGVVKYGAGLGGKGLHGGLRSYVMKGAALLHSCTLCIAQLAQLICYEGAQLHSCRGRS